MAGKSLCSVDPILRGQRLSQFMSEKNLRLQDIADKFKPPKNINTISRWRSGQYPMPDKVADSLTTEYRLDKKFFYPEKLSKTIELANLESKTPEELLDITHIFLRNISTLANSMGVKKRIVFYSLNSLSPFSRLPQVNLIESSIRSCNQIEIPHPIILGMRAIFKDDPQLYNDDELLRKKLGLKVPKAGIEWDKEPEYLRKQVNDNMELLSNSEKISVFPLVPQPLLVQLGHLLMRFQNVEIFEPQADLQGWGLSNTDEKVSYLIRSPKDSAKTVALNLSLSTSIEDSVIEQKFNGKTAIWTLTTKKPRSGFLKTKRQLNDFRESYREIMARIRTKHNNIKVLNVFLSLPFSTAFEVGRLWEPSLDPDLKLYGLDGETGKYRHLYTISSS